MEKWSLNGLALTFSIPEESVFNITWVSVKQNLGGFSPILNWKSTMAFNLRGIGGRRPEKRFGWLGKLLLTLAMHSKLLCGKWHKCKYSDKYKYKYKYNANTNTDWGNYYQVQQVQHVVKKWNAQIQIQSFHIHILCLFLSTVHIILYW